MLKSFILLKNFFVSFKKCLKHYLLFRLLDIVTAIFEHFKIKFSFHLGDFLMFIRSSTSDPY